MRGVKSVAATMNWGVHTKPALDEMEAEMGVGAPKHRPCPFRLLMCSLKYVLPIVVKWNIEWLGWLGGRAQKLGCWRSSLLRRRGPTSYRAELQSSANHRRGSGSWSASRSTLSSSWTSAAIKSFSDCHGPSRKTSLPRTTGRSLITSSPFVIFLVAIKPMPFPGISATVNMTSGGGCQSWHHFPAVQEARLRMRVARHAQHYALIKLHRRTSIFWCICPKF